MRESCVGGALSKSVCRFLSPCELEIAQLKLGTNKKYANGSFINTAIHRGDGDSKIKYQPF